MGKTAQGAVWLDAELLSPYDFYQYWINISDADVEKLFKVFTFLPIVEILQLASLPGAEIRQAKERLAYEVTSLVHGRQEAEKARDAARALFAGEGQGEAIPTTELNADELAAGIPLARLMQRVGLARSLSDARRLIEQGGAYLNEQVISSVDAMLTSQDISVGSALLRAGKKRYHRIVLRK